MAKYGYTLVQHSGFGYAGKPGFERGVETREVNLAVHRDLVRKVGGVLVTSDLEIDELEEQVNYPEGHESIYPAAQGTFATQTLDGLRIYIPKVIA